jgi:hypothetical protein
LSPVSLVILAFMAVAAFVAERLGGSVGTGVMLGSLLGAGFAMIGVLWVRHALLYRPARALRAQGEMFLVKFGGAIVCAFCFRFVDLLARIADWRAMLIAYVAAAFVVMVAGVFGLQRVARERRLEKANFG